MKVIENVKNFIGEIMADNVEKSIGCSSCSENGACSSCASSTNEKRPGETDQQFEDRQAIKRRLRRIKHKIVVMSGKGGVGKSTVAVNMAVSLALAGKKVGLMDVDIHGPSVPTMLNLEHSPLQSSAEGIYPISVGELKVMSIGFLLKDPSNAVIWRGPMKMGAIQQFVKDVEWGDLDYLIIDSPPGTGDEPLSVCQIIEDLDGAVIVTTPQKVSITDVEKSINFCRQLDLHVLGIVENMNGFVCPECGTVTHMFKEGGGKKLAEKYKINFLGSIPMDPDIGTACDNGTPFVHKYAKSETAKIIEKVIDPILELSI